MRNLIIVLLCGLLIITLVSSSVIIRNPGCNGYDEQGVCKSCSVRFYKDQNNICQPVNPNCKTYDQSNGDCLSCYPGFGLLQGTCLPGLEDTMVFDPNCNQFKDSKCVKCSFGYYFNQDGNCAKADPSCLTFDQTNGQCLSCYPGFALSTGKCNPSAAKPLDPNCNQFDSNNLCIKCSYGFYFNNGSCKKIDDSCKTFSEEKGICVECYSGYMLNTDQQCVKQPPKQNTNPLCAQWTNNQCTKCSKGSTFNQQGACILLDSYCKTFDSISGRCSKCYSGYVLNTDGVCQVETPKAVSDPNCYSFGGNGQCSKCSAGYYFNALRVCVKIDDSCKAFSVSKNKCMQCYPGYQLGSTGQCLVASAEVNDVNCAQWNGQTCVKCSFGSVFNQNGKCVLIDSQCKQYDYNLRQCTQCYYGYALDDTFNCVQSVNQVRDNLCAEWQSDICIRCSFGSFFNQQGICTLFDPSCRQADQFDGKCTSCYPGYELSQQKTCVKSAHSNNPDNLCSQWDSTGSVCITCSKGSFFNTDGICELIDPLCKASNEMNGQCTDCFDGYELNENGKCIPTRPDIVIDQLCAQFSNGKCAKCSFGAFFNQDDICELIDAHCAQFDPSSKSCARCYPGYVLQENKCIVDTTFSLSDPYCSEFSNGICLRCSTGYYFEKDGKCTAADPLCATFDEMNGDCLTCFTGYAVQSGLCIPSQDPQRDPNCASFNPDNTCRKCSKGFFFNYDRTQCQVANPLCKSYDQQTGACLTCYSGYIVEDLNCVFDKNAQSNLCAESIDGICIRCASRTFLNEIGECQKVSEDCRTYNDLDGKCLSCYIGFTLTSGVCAKSDLQSGCSQFTPSGQCTKCSPGYYLFNRQCTQIDPQCANFNPNLGRCEGCYSGYTLLQEKCEISEVNEEFQVENCIAYNTDNKCIQCFDRFYLSNNQCKDVSVFCKTYDLITGQCTGCYSTFKLANGQCTK